MENLNIHKKCLEKIYEAFLRTIQGIIVSQWKKYVNSTSLWQPLKDKAWLPSLNCK